MMGAAVLYHLYFIDAKPRDDHGNPRHKKNGDAVHFYGRQAFGDCDFARQLS